MDYGEIVRQRLALYEAASTRSSYDAAFRRRLVTAPRETLDVLAGELGLFARVPDAVDVAVHEWSASRLHLVLPPPVERPLTDAQLDGVVGGFGMMDGARVRSDGDAHGCPLCPHPSNFAATPTRF
jgi:hypothetical protein